MMELLEEYDKQCRKSLTGLIKMKESSQRDALVKRWSETRDLVVRAMEKLEEEDGEDSSGEEGE
jgi:hypothetical protein